jgi:replicative DNA helicase
MGKEPTEEERLAAYFPDRDRRKRSTSISPIMEHGKLPPQAIDLEEIVLGAIMLEKDALLQVIDLLKPEIFYKESHQKICFAIIDLFKNTQPIDILTVTERLKKLGELELVGGPYYVTRLTARVASSANIEYHLRILLQKYIQRELIRISSATIHDAFEDSTDALNLLATAEAQMMSIAESSILKRAQDYNDALGETISEIIAVYKNPTKLTGIPSGFIDLDRKTSGWQDSDLIIMAGRPGMGKSTEVLNCAINACEFGYPVAMFSLEMSIKQLLKKIISNKCDIDLSRMNNGNITELEADNITIFKSNNMPLFIDDTPALSTMELRAKAIRLKHKYGIKMIIVDYLQLMVASGLTKGDNREREISKITQSLKALAKELDIPIIALSQLSRAVEQRPNKRPILSDLRESGSIEQEADVVIFIYRAEYYKYEVIECGGIQYPSHGLCLNEIAKGRNIALGEILLKFTGSTSRFQTIETEFRDMNQITESKEKEETAPF